MRWTKESFAAKRARINAAGAAQFKELCEWHPWFAWRPVTIGSFICGTDSAMAWLCWTERRLSWLDRRGEPFLFSRMTCEWEYRLPPDRDRQ